MSLQRRWEDESEVVDALTEYVEPPEQPAPQRGDVMQACPIGEHGEYSLIAGSEEFVSAFMEGVQQAADEAHAEEAQEQVLIAEKHPWAQFERPRSGRPKAPEFVVDDIIRAGNTVLSGNRGIGKTSLMVPLLFGIAGLIDYPLPISIKRKIVLVTEDSEQIWDVVEAMKQAGILKATDEEIFEMFKVVNSVRMKPSEIVKVSSSYAALETPNERVDGSTMWASPFIVMDTISANIDLDNISDNSEVARAVALIRERFRGMSTLMVGHMAKAMTRSEAKDPSMIGAQAFEADTQGCLYVIKEGDEVYLTLGKQRFNPLITEYGIDSHVETFEAEGPLGEDVTVRARYNLLVPLAAGEKDERKQAAKAEANLQKLERLKGVVLKFLAKQDEPMSTANVRGSVTGNHSDIGVALESLWEDGEILKEEGARGANMWSVPQFNR